MLREVKKKYNEYSEEMYLKRKIREIVYLK